MANTNTVLKPEPDGNGKVIRLRPEERVGRGAGLWVGTFLALGAADVFFMAVGKTLFGFDTLIIASFWCMAVMIAFGFVWSYLWKQVPRSGNGAELTLPEIDKAIAGVDLGLSAHMRGENLNELMRVISFSSLRKPRGPASALIYMLFNDLVFFSRLRRVERALENITWLSGAERRKVITLLGERVLLSRRKDFLPATRLILSFWYALSAPVAVLMIFVVLIHALIFHLFGF